VIALRQHIPGGCKCLPLLCALALGAGGCFTLNFDAKPGKLAQVQPTTPASQPRVGNVYMIRGWLGIFSCGLDQIQKQIIARGVSSRIYLGGQWPDLAAAISAKYKNCPDHEPLVLIGHSFGADDVVKIANVVAKDGVRVDLAITLDPMVRPPAGNNIQWCVDIYQFSSPLPIKDGGPVRMDNFNVRKNRTDLWVFNTNHINLPNNVKVQQEVIKEILQVCQPRAQWLAAHRSPSPPLAMHPATQPGDQATAPPAAPVRDP